MKDFIKEIEKALPYKENWNEDELIRFVRIFEEKGCGKDSWDPDCGEEICYLYSNDKKLLALIHSKFPIAIVSPEFRKYNRKAGYIFSKRIHTVKVRDFNKNFFRVDLTKLKELAPEIDWIYIPDAVDPQAFSALDYSWSVNN